MNNGRDWKRQADYKLIDMYSIGMVDEDMTLLSMIAGNMAIGIDVDFCEGVLLEKILILIK